MSKIRRVDFSPDEWLAGTRELSLEERGAYWDVCALLYSRGGPIADDEAWLAKALTCHVRTWRTIRGRLLATGKLALIDGKLVNLRTLREIQRAESRLKSSRKAAEESVKSRRERVENASLTNEYNDIPEATASDFNGAIYQLTTINDQNLPLQETTTESLQREKVADSDSSAGAPDDAERLMASWNAAAEIVNDERGHAEWPMVLKLNSERRRKIKNILKAYPVEEVERALHKATADKWARGETPRPAEHADWQFNFDHFIKEKTITRFVEKTDGQRPRNHSSQSSRDNSPELAGISAALARRSVQPG